MKQILDFLKTTAMGGFFVLLPVVLLYFAVGEMIELVIGLATPLADLFPEGTFDKVEFPGVLAGILIIAVSFLIGLAMRSTISRGIGKRIEESMLKKVPGYQMIKGLTEGLASADRSNAFRPGVLVMPNGNRTFVYVIEDPGDGKLTVLQPSAPSGTIGGVQVVATDQVHMLDAKLGDVMQVLNHWGVGSQKLLEKEKPPESTPRF